MNRSRTRNVARNIAVALLCQTVNLVCTIVSRTIFINILGAEYLGINGLYTNILTILSFAELGIGNAIIFSMYKPLASADTEKIKSLMAFYKKTYDIIAIVIFVGGIGVVPFLKYIIKDAPNINENLSLLYLLFLANTVISYFYIYKRSIIIADQKNHIVLYITQLVQTIRIIGQSIILYLTHDFVLFLIIQICCTIICNLVTAIKAEKMYPYLKDPAMPLSNDESSRIFRNVRALVVYKFGSVILNGTDNIIISAMAGVANVGLISNYALFTSACTTIIGRITEAFTASVGNLNAIGNKQQKYDIFQKIFFISAWIYGFATVGLVIMSNRVISVWLGNDYLMSKFIVVSFMIGFYVSGVHFAAYTYRTTLGYFIEGKMAPLLAAILNFVFSIIGYQIFGIAGIFIATPISRYFTVGLVDPYLIYKKSFYLSSFRYHVTYFTYAGLFTVLYFICENVVAKILLDGWAGIVLQIMSITVVFNSIMVLAFCRNKMFKSLFEVVKNLLIMK